MNLFHRLGRAAARYRYVVIAAWIVLLVAAVPFAPQLPGALRSGGFTLDDLEASKAEQALGALNVPPSAMVIVLQSTTDARAGDSSFEAAAAAAIAKVPQAAHVTGVLTHLLAPRQVSADRKTVYEIVTLDLSPDDSPEALQPVEDAITPVDGLQVMLAGGPAFYGDIQVLSENDLRRSEFISLPLAALALLLVFGSVIAAGVPIVVGGTAVVVALGALFFVAQQTALSIFVLNLATLLGLGLGVDYALLLTSRFREELKSRGGGRLTSGAVDQNAVNDAVAATVATAGRAVFFSGLTVLLGLIGLILFEFMVLRSVGIAGAMVVGLAVASAVTLLPAVLATLGPRVDAYPVHLRGRVSRLLGRRPKPPAPDGEGAWGRLARRVMDHPLLVFIPTLTALLILGSPFLHAHFNSPDASILPPGVPSRVAFDTLASDFGEGEFSPLIVAVKTNGPVTDPANVALLYDYSRRLAADTRVTRVESYVDVDPRLTLEQYQLLYSAPGGPADRFVAQQLAATTRDNLAAFTVFTPYGPNRIEGQRLVADIRTPGSSVAPPPGVSVLVGGGAAEVRDVVQRIASDFPRSAAFILISTYLVLFVLLRSVVLPAKALIVNALSITASFGALVWIFQDGNLSALLGFAPLGFVETTLPVILFCVLFGLSMDYEVFLLSRMKEVYDKTGDNREAVIRGMERSGRIVSSAALIVVVVAGSFAFADIVLIKALGLGVAIAVALDATLVRGLLVPSAMRLLGDLNWWLPARLKRLIGTRLHLPETAALPWLLLVLALVTTLVVGCSPTGQLLANPVPAAPAVPSTAPFASHAPDPQPISLPRDEAPHDRLTEWWYYTGHLASESGREFGFEFVIFRAERGSFPVSWASHLALTDEQGNRFLYEQRSEIGPQVDVAAGPGFSFSLKGTSDQGVPDVNASPWLMSGLGGQDSLSAATPSFAIHLSLASVRSLPVLHDDDGWVDFGPAGGSYYYSWPRMTASGSVSLDGTSIQVTGEAWFDHQWGDFIAVGGGGWDWFAVNLADGTDFTLSLVRAADGSYPLIYGTYVAPDGTVTHLPQTAFKVTPAATWTSPATGATYPAGWQIEIPSQQLTVDLTPTVADQELDTRATTGVIYWEGSQLVSASRSGAPLSGEAYVELTGYAAAN
ncbi:MAG TPA: MMPL family transporter [Candidatus Limnocylindrales bacterium]